MRIRVFSSISITELDRVFEPLVFDFCVRELNNQRKMRWDSSAWIR